MAWDAGAIVGSLGLDLDKFTSSILKAEGLAELMPRWVTDFMVSPLLGVTDAAKEAGHALIDAIGETANKAFDIAMEAQRAGTSIKFFSEWSEIAKDVNLTGEDLGQTFVFLNRSIAELADGEAPKEVIAAFQQIGISQDWAQQHLGDTEAIFNAVRQGLRDITTESERVNAAREILGRGGPRSINLFQISDEDVQKRKDVSHQMGVIEDDESARSAKHYHELLVTATEAWEGIKKQLSEPFLDYFSEHKDDILAGIEQTHQSLVHFAQGINVHQVVEEFLSLLSAVGDVAKVIDGLIKQMMQLQAGLEQLRSDAQSVQDKGGDAADEAYVKVRDATGIDDPARDLLLLEHEHKHASDAAQAAYSAMAADRRSGGSREKEIEELKAYIGLQQQVVSLNEQINDTLAQTTGKPMAPGSPGAVQIDWERKQLQEALLQLHGLIADAKLPPIAPAPPPPPIISSSPMTAHSPQDLLKGADDALAAAAALQAQYAQHGQKAPDPPSPQSPSPPPSEADIQVAPAGGVRYTIPTGDQAASDDQDLENALDSAVAAFQSLPRDLVQSRVQYLQHVIDLQKQMNARLQAEIADYTNDGSQLPEGVGETLAAFRASLAAQQKLLGQLQSPVATPAPSIAQANTPPAQPPPAASTTPAAEGTPAAPQAAESLIAGGTEPLAEALHLHDLLTARIVAAENAFNTAAAICRNASRS